MVSRMRDEAPSARLGFKDPAIAAAVDAEVAGALIARIAEGKDGQGFGNLLSVLMTR